MNQNELITGKKYIRQIFSNDSFYNIPEYQRPYVWGDENINALLNDLFSAYQAPQEKEYFLGCMILNEKNFICPQKQQPLYTYYDILDGQQRFITLMLLHVMFRELSSDPQIHDAVRARLYSVQDVLNGIPERERIQFEIRDDADFIQTYLLADEPIDFVDMKKLSETLENESIANMANALCVMADWFEQIGQEIKTDFQETMLHFFSYISTKTIFLYLATPDNLDDAYNLFTVMNSRGVQLQNTDILRAQNLRVIDDLNQRKEYAKKWEDYIDAIAYPFCSLEEFIWYVIDMQMKFKSDENKTLSKAFDWMYKKKADHKAHLKPGFETFHLIEKYIKHFQAISQVNLDIKPLEKQIFTNISHILNQCMGAQYLLPILYFREKFGDCYILDFLVKIDNLMSMNWLLGRRTIQTRLHILLRKMDEIKERGGDGLNMLQCEELNYAFQANNASTQLNPQEFFDLLYHETFGAFGGSKINKTRYLLLKLDLIMGSPRHTLHFNKHSCSIEHLMPRKLQADHHYNNAFHKKMLHKLGNLILLDKKKNSSLCNADYHVKKSKYKDAVESRVNTNYVFLTYEQWREQDIDQNHIRVVEKLKEYYQQNQLAYFL